MIKPLKILVIDDEKLIRWSFEKRLTAKGHKVFTAGSADEAAKLFDNDLPDLVFLDNHLPGKNGLDLIPEIKAKCEEVHIVFMTAYESVDVAVEAMKRGAFEYIHKPFNFEEIYVIIEQLSKKINIEKELTLLRREQKEQITFQHIIYESTVMKSIVQISKKIAATEATSILLLGESGTGKDVFARAIHNESNRSKNPFVTINCSSLPDTLLESELFGHEKGAYTDAKKLKKGLFEMAEGGTVFLDEIGEINATTQIKLLNVVENHTIMRLGGTREIKVDVRIIAATNKNLKESIKNSTFREDLYYRLQVFQIEIPPLKDRKEDIEPLLNSFIELFNKAFQKSITSISPRAKELLQLYHWPGNVRELRNVVERAVILQNGHTFDINTLPAEISHIQPPTQASGIHDIHFPEEGISLESLEKQAIIKALSLAQNNQTKAAQLLQISRDTLRYKIKKHKIS